MEEQPFNDLFFVRGGCPIHYWLVGDKDSPLITFIHGAGVDHSMFAPQTAVIAPSFQSLLWDMRGQGKSQPSVTPFSVHSAAEDLLALLDNLGYSQTVLVGVSLGGTIAQEVALCFPERVKALVIVGAPCNTLPLTPLTQLLLQVFMCLVRRAPIGVIRRSLAFFASKRKDARRYVYEAFVQIREQDHRQIWEAFYDIFRPVPALKSINVTHKILLIRGQYDIFWNRWLLDFWAKHRPGILYAVLPKAGHLANWDEASIFNELLVNFLNNVLLGGIASQLKSPSPT